MKKYSIIILTLLPLSVFAEGQDVFGIIFGTIDFIKVFGIWAILIWGLIRTFEYFKSNKLEKKKKGIIWITTGLISLFIWSMIIHDPYPYDGPIDSLFKKIITYDLNRVRPDSTIEYKWSMDKSEEGAYIWLSNKKIFVRKLTDKEKSHEGLSNSLTLSVVRGWNKK